MVASAAVKNAVAAGAVIVGAVAVNRSLTTSTAAPEKLSANYPPNGLSPGVQKLPEWIQKGCGNT